LHFWASARRYGPRLEALCRSTVDHPPTPDAHSVQDVRHGPARAILEVAALAPPAPTAGEVPGPTHGAPTRREPPAGGCGATPIPVTALCPGNPDLLVPPGAPPARAMHAAAAAPEGPPQRAARNLGGTATTGAGRAHHDETHGPLRSKTVNGHAVTVRLGLLLGDRVTATGCRLGEWRRRRPPHRFARPR
jgi:hypothetical protein